MLARRRFRSRRGVSLPEVITAAAMFFVLLTGLVTMSLNSGLEWCYGTAKIRADDSASLAIQDLAREIRNGTSATVDTTGTQLTVQFPATNSQGDFDRDTAGTVYRYYLSSGRLCRQQGSASAVVLARNVTGLRFGVDGDEVSLQVTSQQQAGSRSGTTSLNTRVALRNPAPN